MSKVVLRNQFRLSNPNKCITEKELEEILPNFEKFNEFWHPYVESNMLSITACISPELYGKINQFWLSSSNESFSFTVNFGSSMQKAANRFSISYFDCGITPSNVKINGLVMSWLMIDIDGESQNNAIYDFVFTNDDYGNEWYDNHFDDVYGFCGSCNIIVF
jgi:hypothetical protein